MGRKPREKSQEDLNREIAALYAQNEEAKEKAFVDLMIESLLE